MIRSTSVPAAPAHYESQLADHIAARDDWDLATLEISVNTLEFTDDQFRQRVSYMVHIIAAANPARPIFPITLWLFFGDHNPQQRNQVARFRQHLRDVVAGCPTPNAHLLEGPALLRNFTGLTEDLINPGDPAMVEIGWRLAEAIRPQLPTRAAPA